MDALLSRLWGAGAEAEEGVGEMDALDIFSVTSLLLSIGGV